MRTEADAKALAEVKAAAPVDVPATQRRLLRFDARPPPTVVDRDHDPDTDATATNVDTTRSAAYRRTRHRELAPAGTGVDERQRQQQRSPCGPGPGPTESALVDAAASGQAPKRTAAATLQPRCDATSNSQSLSTYKRVTGNT